MARKLNIVRQIWAGKGSYSQRKGLIDLESLIQRNELNERTRVKIIDSFFELYNLIRKFHHGEDYKSFFRNLCADMFSCSKYVSVTDEDLAHKVEQTILLCNYNEVFDFCEKVYKELYESEKDIWEIRVNDIFDKESVCHRMVNGLIIDELNDDDMRSVKDATSDNDEASTFMQKAIHALYKLKDMENAVLNSIHAVESVAKKLTNVSGGTLADAVKKLEAQGKIHPALSLGLKNIYGYTSDTVRHAKGEKKNPPSYEEAKYMLLFCSSTVNFLRSFEDRSA